jgi:hypothetical protein
MLAPQSTLRLHWTQEPVALQTLPPLSEQAVPSLASVAAPQQPLVQVPTLQSVLCLQSLGWEHDMAPMHGLPLLEVVVLDVLLVLDALLVALDVLLVALDVLLVVLAVVEPPVAAVELAVAPPVPALECALLEVAWELVTVPPPVPPGPSKLPTSVVQLVPSAAASTGPASHHRHSTSLIPTSLPPRVLRIRSSPWRRGRRRRGPRPGSPSARRSVLPSSAP